MSSPPLTSFQIGWICALPIEFAAAKEMLDEKFGILEEQDSADTNMYTLGRIGRHNIVIANLPEGQYGTTSATTVAIHMMRTFSRTLRIGLMVGIGGGIPSPNHDIRLGDIVVSHPEGACGGVLQYDMGKVVDDPKLHRTGSLNNPPRSLLAAVTKMKAAEFTDDPSYPEYIETATRRTLRTRQSFGRPNVSTDRLFKIEHNHPTTAAMCDTCLPEWEENRDAREEPYPKVFYGIIASGNAVIKHGATRERLRRETAALCFEMEAAGLMMDFPCLVVRGICDYADSHKNEQWQGYAALAAASYAKELLSYMPVTQVSQERLVAEILSEGAPLRRDAEAENSILSTWQISFNHIRQTRPTAANILSLMSICDEQGIPEILLRGQSVHKNDSQEAQQRAFEMDDENDCDSADGDGLCPVQEGFCSNMSDIEAWIKREISQDGVLTATVQLDLHELLAFIECEFPSEFGLDKIFTVTGSAVDAIATTIADYVELQWPGYGLQVLDWFSGFINSPTQSSSLDLQMESLLRLRVDHHNTRNLQAKKVTLSGSQVDLADVVAQLAWMLSVLRKPCEKGLALSKVLLTYSRCETIDMDNHELHHVFKIQLQELQLLEASDVRGSCWNPIFSSFVIADGFRIPTRPRSFYGLEVPLRLLTLLAQVDYPLQYRDSCVLKGRRNALLPVFDDHNTAKRSIQWHLIRIDGKSDLSMEWVHKIVQQGKLSPCVVSFETFVDGLDNDKDRHFLGLYDSATIHLGTKDSKAEEVWTVQDMVNVKPITGPRIVWKRNFSPSFSVAIPPISVGASTAFDICSVGQSVRAQLSIDRQLDERLTQSCANLTVLYDAARKIAWLVPEIFAILHLLQAHTRRQQRQVSFPKADQMTIHNLVATCRDFLGQAAEAPHLSTNAFMFLQFDTIFRQMKESVILHEHGGRLKLFSNERKLIGVDFCELSQLPNSYCPKQVGVNPDTSGSWLQILRGNAEARDSNKILTLLCKNLNRPIRPSDNAKTCGTWATPIPAMDYLITTMACIKLLNHRHGSDPPKLSPSLYWSPGNMFPFDECQGRSCNRLQRLSKDAPQHRQDLTRLINSAPDGAVVFGGEFDLDPKAQCHLQLTHMDRTENTIYSGGRNARQILGSTHLVELGVSQGEIGTCSVEMDS